MELYKEILVKNVVENAILSGLETVQHNGAEVVESACYKAILAKKEPFGLFFLSRLKRGAINGRIKKKLEGGFWE